MTAVSMERELAVLDAIRVVYKRAGKTEAVIRRSDITVEILEHPKKYGIRVFNISELERSISSVCNEHFTGISENWRNGVWIVRGVAE